MSFTQDRGITPPEQEDEPRTIDDPELLALLEGNRQRGRIIRAELIQAAIDEQNALYQPPPDIRTPDRQPSPTFAGLPSPDSSPPPSYHQQSYSFDPTVITSTSCAFSICGDTRPDVQQSYKLGTTTNNPTPCAITPRGYNRSGVQQR
ncbi:MAG: hypothetical protein LQ344_006688 [Seirophora lacunosa]|nr:MAG: hypothetical protein LQ344_006688 [Seirophora lacunosa]